MADKFGNKIRFIKVPLDFYDRAKQDIDTFLRDDAGEPTISIRPLFRDVSKFFECIDKTIINPLDDRTLALSDSFHPDPDKNYYMHLDGSAGGDGYGIAMASLEGWKDKAIVRIDLLGCPSKRSYGKDFKAELVEEVVKELVYRGFLIKILTYDRATIVRDLKPILEGIGGIVEPMSIDRTSNFPILDYDTKEPPFFRTESTQGNYYTPMVDFRDTVERTGIIAPYHSAWIEIPYAFEINTAKKIVTKFAGKLDDLGQACAGAVFHVLNNEKDSSKGMEVKEWNPKEQPDSFEKQIELLQNQLEKREKKPNTFDYEPLPDEISTDDFDSKIRDRYYF
jgi:hypothetical protein